MFLCNSNIRLIYVSDIWWLEQKLKNLKTTDKYFDLMKIEMTNWIKTNENRFLFLCFFDRNWLDLKSLIKF